MCIMYHLLCLFCQISSSGSALFAAIKAALKHKTGIKKDQELITTRG